MGKCTSCGEWNTLVETPVSTKIKSQRSKIKNSNGRVTVAIYSSLQDTSSNVRVSSGLGEFDRVLGGGFVPGQAVLLAGEPGIGKSTVLLQIADSVKLSGDSSVVYVCGEESTFQIKLRGTRLGVSGSKIRLVAETDVDALLNFLSGEQKLGLIIIDSVQTLTTNDLASATGSVAQVKECAGRVLKFVKEHNIPTLFIGHVNKDGEIAGPKVLEHMVDTVMYLEGERFGSLRLLRSVKNRFGDVGEVGVFQMEDKGFVEVKNPSATFIEERAKGAGSVVTVTMEGTRPVLLEVQALVSKTSFNYPRRSASGFDLNRLYFICAVVEKHLKIPLQGFDVYVNVTSGAKITEPSADLAVALAIASSFKNRATGPKTVAFGELGLSGEVRMVGSQKRREGEAKKLGFSNLVGPAQVKTLLEATRLAL
jgi:DNA repair protein RadA/Sms